MLAALAGRPAARAVAPPVVTPVAVGGAAPATPQPSVQRRTTSTPPKRPKRREEEAQEEEAISSEIHTADCEKPGAQGRTALKARMRSGVRKSLAHRGLELRDELVVDAMEE
eukprot:12811446-Heterocapsa_arctica.AAC.1